MNDNVTEMKSLQKLLKNPKNLYIAFGSLAAIVLAWYSLFLEGFVPLDGNMLRLTFPQWAFFQKAMADGHSLLWNPYRNMGEPYWADPQTMVVYPLYWLLGLLPGFLNFLRGWVLVHSLIGAGFAAGLAFRWFKDHWSAAAAGILVCFNGFFVARITLPNHFASAVYLPAALYFQDKASWMGLGIVLALQWTAGFPPFSLLTGLLTLVIAWRVGKDSLLVWAKGAGLGAGLAAVQWVPFLEYLSHSTRPVLLESGVAAKYSVPPLQFLKELLLPQWYFFQPQVEGDLAMVTFYVGIIAVGLSGWALWKGAKREHFWGWIILAAVVLSFGQFLPGFRQFSLMHVFRFPSNWLLWASLGVAFLSAAGIARVPSKRFKMGLVILLGLDVMGFCAQTRSVWMAPSFLTEPPQMAKTWRQFKNGERIFHNPFLDSGWPRERLSSVEDWTLMKEYVIPSVGMAYGIPEARSYQVLRLKKADAYQTRMLAAPANSPLWKWPGVAVLIQPEKESPNENIRPLAVLGHRGVAPRVFIPDGQGMVSLTQMDPGFVEATVQLENPNWAVFSEVFMPGWKVLIDGHQGVLDDFEETFMAVPLAAGTHRLVFYYSPKSFWVGFGISLLSTFLLVFWQFYGKRRFSIVTKR